MMKRTWSFGDRVVHTGRPEWGVGLVTSVEASTHEGASCQRLNVRFDRAGVKTLNSVLADLVPASQVSSLPEEPAKNGSEQSEAAWLAQMSAPKPLEMFLRLPDACTDPFSTFDMRYKATLALYRFSDHGSSLLDWAAAQSGLKDPLSRFARHELEGFFKRFAVVRDEHLRKLSLDLKRQDPGAYLRTIKTVPPAAVAVLRRYDLMR